MADCLTYASRAAGVNPATIFLGVAFAIPKAKKRIFEAEYKACKECERRVDSQLAGLPFSFRKNIKKACQTKNKPTTACEFIETMPAVEQTAFQKYGFNCAFTGSMLDNQLQKQESDFVAATEQNNDQIKMFGGILLIVIVLGFMYFLTKNNNTNAAN